MSPCAQPLAPFAALFAQANFNQSPLARSHWQGRELLLLQTTHMQAVVSVQGAQLLHFQPASERPWLWCSTLWPEKGAIRGGVPVCWPWFGPHASDKSLPAHGWARISQWQLLDVLLEGEALLLNWQLRCADYQAQLQMRLGQTFSLKLITQNLGGQALPLSQALHAYWQVSFIDNACETSLADARYHDKLDGEHKQQLGVVRFNQPLDRVYFAEKALCLHDSVWRRQLLIDKHGSDSSVLWHPGRQGLADAPPVLAAGFVCAEVADGLAEPCVLQPGERKELIMTAHSAPLVLE